MTSLTTRPKASIARPLKVLVPLIRDELEAGQSAGLEHYRRAGEMLNEAKEQMPYGNWRRWLSKNFTLSSRTAAYYMGLAKRISQEDVAHRRFTSVREVLGRRDDQRSVHPSWGPTLKAARNLDADLFAQERQSEDDEIEIRRELVGELIDLGFKALATRLHPDRGGSKDAMVRLNQIREQLTQIAKTRRWV
jgi:hypothetical protein